MSNTGHNDRHSDPHLAELQAIKQMISAMVLHQDRLLTRISAQQDIIGEMQKQQDDMAFEIAELRRINNAQNDQLVMIRRDMNSHWNSLKSHTAPLYPHLDSAHHNGVYFNSNGSNYYDPSSTSSFPSHANGHVYPQSPQ
jgi:hypothetical protein